MSLIILFSDMFLPILLLMKIIIVTTLMVSICQPVTTQCLFLVVLWGHMILYLIRLYPPLPNLLFPHNLYFLLFKLLHVLIEKEQKFHNYVKYKTIES